MTVAGDDFRATMRRWPTGVTVITTRTDRGHHGMTANSFTAVSLDPVLVLVCVEKSARFHEAVLDSGVFGVSVLAEDQIEIARWFALRGRPYEAGDFADFAHHVSPANGVLLLDEAVATLDCATSATFDGGDHTVVLAEVVAVDVPRPDAQPLVYYDADYRRLSG